MLKVIQYTFSLCFFIIFATYSYAGTCQSSTAALSGADNNGDLIPDLLADYRECNGGIAGADLTGLSARIPNIGCPPSFISDATTENEPIGINNYSFTPGETVESMVWFRDGKAYLVTNDSVTLIDTGNMQYPNLPSKNGMVKFVLSEDGVMYITKRTSVNGKTVVHPSIVAGDSKVKVVAAGYLKIENGVITEASSYSEHYKPNHNQNTQNVNQFLNGHGITNTPQWYST